jgi:hypothetical protein
MKFNSVFLSFKDLIIQGDKYVDFYNFPEDNSLGIRVFNKEEKNNFKFIENAYYLNRLAFEKGIRVPKPYGIREVKIGEEVFFGIILEKLNGETLDNLVGVDFEDARDSWLKEIIRANKLGFSCNDSSRKQNAFWVPEEKKTYLIDCDFWKYKGKGWGDF